jgi:hypothetical protein
MSPNKYRITFNLPIIRDRRDGRQGFRKELRLSFLWPGIRFIQEYNRLWNPQANQREQAMTRNTGAAILNRLIDPETDDLSSEAATSLLELDFPEADHVRMAELSSMAQTAALTEEDRIELEEYIRVADLLAVLQSKARRSLLRLGRAS